METSVAVDIKEMDLSDGIVREVDGLSLIEGWFKLNINQNNATDEIRPYIKAEVEVKDHHVVKAIITNEDSVIEELVDTEVPLSLYEKVITKIEEDIVYTLDK